MLTYFASAPHYAEHLLPIWAETGGTFLIPDAMEPWARRHGIEPTLLATRYAQAEHLVVASFLDLTLSRAIHTALVEHGAGQTYNGGDHPQHHGGYAGGVNRERVELFLCPNATVAQANGDAYPDAETEIVGCPRLDRLLDSHSWYTAARRHRDPAVVAVAWHWPCGLVPEAGTAWPYYQRAVADLADEYTVIGSGHPKYRPQLEPVYRSLGIETEWDFEGLCEKADVLVVDNSSIMYEWAALGRPIVACNSPAYRKGVEHGLRFWTMVPGPQVDRPADLSRAVYAAAYSDTWTDRRDEISEAVYTHLDGTATRRAADALVAWAS